ncbi:hypothetical protein E3P99_01796 [Wallemia hederae]|uniref:Restriction of telomere capping protein 4 n=1 Tax=Wallemia hederae TaxID=1540922 RepID=A0A4T0FR38_9BASI|nr:hypothetical protein E3P99_01796 [Wallemia hederae]
MDNPFAPKPSAKRGPSAPYKQPRSSKVESISLDQAKDYRDAHNTKAKKRTPKRASPKTDSDSDETLQHQRSKPLQAKKNIQRQAPTRVTAETTSYPSLQSSAKPRNRYNEKLKKSSRPLDFSSSEAETEVEEDKPKQRNRTNFMLDAITGAGSQYVCLYDNFARSRFSIRRSPSPEMEEEVVRTPYRYDLRMSESASPPSLEDAFTALPPSSSRSNSPAHSPPAKGKKAVVEDKKKSAKSTGKQPSRKEIASGKKELDMRKVSPKKAAKRKQSGEGKKAATAQKDQSNKTKIKVSRSVNFEDNEDKPATKKRRSNNHISESTDDDSDNGNDGEKGDDDYVEVTNFPAKMRDKKLKCLDKIDTNKKADKTDTIKKATKPAPKKDEGMFGKYDVLNDYISTHSQELRQDSPQLSGGSRKAPTVAVKVSDDESDDEEVGKSDKSSAAARKEPTQPKPKPRPKPQPKSQQNQRQISTFFKPSVRAADMDLCPVCDTELPQLRSQHFKKVLKDFLSIAKASPRSTNPHGMKAHVLAESELCKAHELDTNIIPEGHNKGYPREHDWDKLTKRIIKLTKKIAAVIKSKEDSKFWLKAREDYEKMGSRKANGMTVQFENFEDEQPGYYGEIGLMVISFTLNALSTSKPKRKLKLDPSTTSPLPPKDFIRRVLVPEVANILISEDNGVSMEEAEKIRIESREYGNAVFSGDIKDLSWRPQLPTELISDSD